VSGCGGICLPMSPFWTARERQATCL
jgi:hypothetical protein